MEKRQETEEIFPGTLSAGPGAPHLQEEKHHPLECSLQMFSQG